jgi:carboxylesterase type B
MIPATRPTTTDPTQYFARIAVWSSAEIASAVVALCMPSLKPIFGRLLSDSPKSVQNSIKRSADRDDSGHMMKAMHHQEHRERNLTMVTTDTATTIMNVDVNGSEENLGARRTIVSPDSHEKWIPPHTPRYSSSAINSVRFYAITSDVHDSINTASFQRREKSENFIDTRF